MIISIYLLIIERNGDVTLKSYNDSLLRGSQENHK